jgi:hypothetical protein
MMKYLNKADTVYLDSKDAYVKRPILQHAFSQALSALDVDANERNLVDSQIQSFDITKISKLRKLEIPDKVKINLLVNIVIALAEYENAGWIERAPGHFLTDKEKLEIEKNEINKPFDEYPELS